MEIIYQILLGIIVFLVVLFGSRAVQWYITKKISKSPLNELQEGAERKDAARKKQINKQESTMVPCCCFICEKEFPDWEYDSICENCMRRDKVDF